MSIFERIQWLIAELWENWEFVACVAIPVLIFYI